MEHVSQDISAVGVKFSVQQEGLEVARAYLYVLKNGLHERPFGFMEDVFVAACLRGQGVGKSLVERVVAEARRRDCYKLICTSRYGKGEVHDLYLALGFRDHGKEFRMDF